MTINLNKALTSSKEAYENLSSGLRIALAGIAAIASLTGAVFTIDSRYAHQEAFDTFKKAHLHEDDDKIYEFKKQYLESRLSELDAKQRFNKHGLQPADKYIQDQLQQQLTDLESNRKISPAQ